MGQSQREGSSHESIKPKILSWDVRGLNIGSKRMKTINPLRKWKVDVVSLQETKMEADECQILYI